MYLIVIPVIILIAALVVKKILTSEKVDDFANDFCQLHPKKSTESLCNEGDKVLNALGERVIENTERQELLEEDNKTITDFRSKIKIDVELDELEETSSETTD
jgi:hypothetical protein